MYIFTVLEVFGLVICARDTGKLVTRSISSDNLDPFTLTL